ncbi:BIR7B protein, partial [Odontophorus gujanensis]|nr:BIR7B protein [Odontophorus gujanensis]
MADAAPAEGTYLRTTCYQLFNSSMRDEARRLRTFSQWPQSSPVSAWDLAKAGFYFVGPRDQVQCFSCGGILEDWEPGDCPIVEHLKFFPFCKFIYHEAVRNRRIPLQGMFDSVDGQFLSLLHRIDSEEAALPNQPEYPEMATEEMRLSTFQNWPQHTEMRPEQLARAGFFYTGQGDVVTCFYCDGDMRNWAFGDDPWREHAKWYPRCEFLLQSMGREFVSSVQESFASTPPPSPLSTEEQLRRLQEERMCKLCMDKDVSVVFVPCGHLVACGECALNLRLCPICRAVIRGSVRTYMS